MDLIGIEPMTSSMPWNDDMGVLLTAKDLRVGTAGQNGPIGAKCYQFATKILTEQGRAVPWGSSPKLFQYVLGNSATGCCTITASSHEF